MHIPAEQATLVLVLRTITTMLPAHDAAVAADEVDPRAVWISRALVDLLPVCLSLIDKCVHCRFC